nr:MAG TPA: hypothetical protein [Caudoviricetes sp.]
MRLSFSEHRLIDRFDETLTSGVGNISKRS